MSLTALRHAAAESLGAITGAERRYLYTLVARAVTALKSAPTMSEDAAVLAVLRSEPGDHLGARTDALARAVVRVVIADGNHLPTIQENR
jgi:hypothetical protein